MAAPVFTWRDLPSWQTHGNLFTTEDVDRSALANHPVAHLRWAAGLSDIGALMLWNVSAGDDGGHLAVFTGQSADQERQTLENVGALVNQGRVYASAARRHWLHADCHLEDDGSLFAVYFVPNNQPV